MHASGIVSPVSQVLHDVSRYAVKAKVLELSVSALANAPAIAISAMAIERNNFDFFIKI